MATHHQQHETQASNDVTDPVCGMTIAPADAVGTVEHGGQLYHFCSDSCLERFQANPGEFLGGATPAAAADADAEYTCPMHPEIRQTGPGLLPDLRDGARAGQRHPRGAAERRTGGHDTALLVVARADRADSRLHGRAHAPRAPAPSAARRLAELDRVRPRHSGGAVGRPAVFRTRLGLGHVGPSEHVHADRAGRGRRVRLQRGRDHLPRPVSSVVSHGRSGRRVLRAGRGDRRARAAWPGARTAGEKSNQFRDSQPAGPRAQDRAHGERRWLGTGCSARAGAGGRSPQGPTRRAHPGRWRRLGGHHDDRRVDGDGRANPGREDHRRAGHRRYGQRHRRSSS